MRRIQSSTGLRQRSPRNSELVDAIVVPEEFVVSEPSTTEETVADSIFRESASGTVDNTGRVISSGTVALENKNIFISTIGAAGLIQRITDGTARYHATNPRGRRELSQAVSRVAATTTRSWDRWVAGALGENMTGNVAALTSGKTLAAHGAVYSAQDHATPAFVRNPSCWAAGLDLTGVSPSNSLFAQFRAGTAITRRHVITARHYPLAVGAVVRFVDAANAVVSRTVTGAALPSTSMPDIAVFTLDSDLPAGIAHYKVPPADWSTYLPGQESGRPPIVVLDQEEKVIVRGAWGLNSDFFTHSNYSPSLDISALTESLVPGDSSNPAFALIDPGSGVELVLLGVHYTSGGFSPLSANISTLNELILTADAAAGVSTGYTVTPIDLSPFPSYP